MKKYNLIYIGLGLVIFIYVILRSIFVDITYDEAWTITEFARLDIINIINFTPADANNHLTNSLLIKLFQYLFGENTFVARLPNIIAFAFYLLFSYKIASNFFKPTIGILLFIALFCNPFLLDFFGLARGYGIAISMMVISIYYLFNFIKTKKLKNSYISLILASFAVISNFPLINYWVALFFIINFNFIYSNGFNKKLFKLFVANTIILLALFLIIYNPIRKLIAQNSFYYGGETSFYSDTLHTLTSFSLYDPYDFDTTRLILNSLLLFFAIITISAWIRNFRITTLFNDIKFNISLLLIIPILSNITQFILLGTLYLIDRTALFYFPIIVIVIFTFINDIEYKKTTFLPILYAIIISLALTINQVNNLNFYKTVSWDHDSRTTEILSYLNDIGKAENKIIKFDSSWPMLSSINYYLENKDLQYVNFIKTNRYLIEDNTDYYIFYDKKLFVLLYNPEDHHIQRYDKDTVLQFPKDDLYLFSKLKKTNHPE